MNTHSMNIILFCTIVFLLDFSVSDSFRTERNGIRSERQKIRVLRLEENDSTEKEELAMKNAPKEINVDPRSTYNEKFMALVRSPCRPEYDGFFGATSGDPIRIQYGFKVEVEPLSAIMDILDAIEDRVVDMILQSSFPDMCGLNEARKTRESSQTSSKIMPLVEDPRRSLVKVAGHPSGFRFLKFEEAEKCLPEKNDVNFCGIFTGVLYVYGRHQHGEDASRTIMAYIHEVLSTLDPRDLHSELLVLSSADTFFTVEGHTINQSLYASNSGDNQLSRLGILLIIISSFIAVAIFFYIYIQRNERRYIDSKLSVDNFLEEKCKAITYPVDSFDNINTKTKKGGDGSDEFIDEDLNFEPYRDGRESSGVLL